ncbi:hypothetical protein F4776DRAFT_355988 [Hypoxylon sp. NC0597]|nr:hypothetical protein F4776DRAFT_355988 [Hypoxylon sp. NC0597]
MGTVLLVGNLYNIYVAFEILVYAPSPDGRFCPTISIPAFYLCLGLVVYQFPLIVIYRVALVHRFGRGDASYGAFVGLAHTHRLASCRINLHGNGRPNLVFYMHHP